MSLTDSEIRQAKLPAKPVKMFDERGLFLLLSPAGSRCWRFKYRIDGREKLLAFGIYPDVPLTLARDRREEARQLLAKRIDPGAKRQAEKVSRKDSFEAIALEWLALQEKKLGAATLKKAQWIFENLIFPKLDKRPISTITAPDLLAALRKIEARGAQKPHTEQSNAAGRFFVMRLPLAELSEMSRRICVVR